MEKPIKRGSVIVAPTLWGNPAFYVVTDIPEHDNLIRVARSWLARHGRYIRREDVLDILA